uniref:DNA-directed RNA polymerase n=1 Tax=Babesia rodhaini TaxID=5870 RepID=A0A455QZA5_BABRO|nr:RNA polymerase C1 [Babesia rodhaini]
MNTYYNVKIKFPIILKQISSYSIIKLIVRKLNNTNKLIIGIVSSPITINIKKYSPYNYGLFCEKIFDYIKYCVVCNNNNFNLNKLDSFNCIYCYNNLKKNKYRQYRFGSILLNFPIVINNIFLNNNLCSNIINNINYILNENFDFYINDSIYIIKFFFNNISKFILLNNNKLIIFNNNKKYNNNIIIRKNIITLLFPIIPATSRKLIYTINKNLNINKYYSNLIEINNTLNYKNNYNFISLTKICKLYKLIYKLSNFNKSFKINKKILINLQKKDGILRKLLLGCRSDYSSRVVIIPGSDININNIGVPLNIVKYILSGYILNNNHNNKIIKSKNFKIQLNNIINNNYILTNRPPTLHKMNIQSFSPIIVENKSIKLCPLSCVGYNADFDGDQMSLFPPYFNSSNIESKIKLRLLSNIKSPTTKKNIVSPTQGILIGSVNISMLYNFYFYKNYIINLSINLTDIIEYNNFNNSIVNENKILLKINNKFELTTINRSIIKFNNILFNL